MVDPQHQRRRHEYLAGCEQVRSVSDRKLAHRRGVAPGTLLDPVVSKSGWYGQVQILAGANHSGALEEAADETARAFGLPPGPPAVAQAVGPPRPREGRL